MKKSTPSGPHSTILIGLMLLLSSCQPLIPPTTIDPISLLAVEIVHSSTSRAGELVTWSGFVESTSYNTGMLLMNIFYDELELNFTKIKIVANRTMIWDARQTPMPLVNEQVIVPGVYVIFIGFLYPTPNGTYDIQAEQVFVLPPPDLSSFGHGGPGFLMVPPAKILDIDREQGIIYIMIEADPASGAEATKESIRVESDTKFYFYNGRIQSASFDDLQPGLWIAINKDESDVFPDYPTGIYIMPSR